MSRCDRNIIPNSSIGSHLLIAYVRYARAMRHTPQMRRLSVRLTVRRADKDPGTKIQLHRDPDFFITLRLLRRPITRMKFSFETACKLCGYLRSLTILDIFFYCKILEVSDKFVCIDAMQCFYCSASGLHGTWHSIENKSRCYVI